MDLGLTGKNALVPASSSGLGKDIAKELLKEGANVVICGRNEERLADAQSELASAGGGKVICRTADLSKAEDIRELVRFIALNLGE